MDIGVPRTSIVRNARLKAQAHRLLLYAPKMGYPLSRQRGAINGNDWQFGNSILYRDYGPRVKPIQSCGLETYSPTCQSYSEPFLTCDFRLFRPIVWDAAATVCVEIRRATKRQW